MAEVEGWPVKKLGINDFPYMKGSLEARAHMSRISGLFFAFQLPAIAILSAPNLIPISLCPAASMFITYRALRRMIRQIDYELQTIMPPEIKKFRVGYFLRCTIASQYYAVPGEKLISEAERFLNNATGRKYFCLIDNSVYGRASRVKAPFILQANASAHGNGSRLDLLCLDGWSKGNYADGLLARLASI